MKNFILKAKLNRLYYNDISQSKTCQEGYFKVFYYLNETPLALAADEVYSMISRIRNSGNEQSSSSNKKIPHA